MLYPQDIEQKIGFDKIREWLINGCSGELGRLNVEKVRFSSNKEIITKLCRQAGEFMMLITSGETIPSLGYPDIRDILDKLRVEGLVLETNEVADIQKSLFLFRGWSKFIDSLPGQFTEICALASAINYDQQLVRKIELCIDDKGEIKESASPELRKIRSEIKKFELQARKTLDRVIREARKVDMMPDDSSLTIRGGRLVMPVKAEYKRSVKGFIHDTSASGNILFIEPAEVLEINNDLKELSYAERREILRILKDLTDSIRTHRESIAVSYKILGILDLVKSKAKLSIKLDARVPETNREGKLEWVAASNPVLRNALEKQGKKVVPLTIKLDRHQRILLISGPNAGGKSVCLKTIGLLQYMYQCGLPIPVMEGSSTLVFKDIFIDIGDEQSIEDDLSTYSSHLKSMHHFLKFTSKNSLFLIDEFGSGTDPQFGGAIAEAMLEQLSISQGFGVITTHYNNLKKLGDAHPAMVNGRMRFDVQKLEPLYMLETGKPGSSFALEIAGKIGLPKNLIRAAKQKVGTDAVQLDRLLTELEDEKKNFEEQGKKLGEQNRLLEKTIENYKILQMEMDQKKKDILNQARQEAKNLLKQTNQKVENLIRQIRENKAEKQITKKLREDLKVFDEEIIIEAPVKNEEKIKVVSGKIIKGNLVRIIGQEPVGEVIVVGKNDAEVVFGDLKSKIKLGRLEKISRGQAKKVETRAVIKGINLVERRANFSSDLDIRGKRAEESLPLLNSFLDNAILFGTPEVRIIHGKGDGILRQVIRNELNQVRQVKRFHDEHADRGGAGITVVEFD